MHLDWDGDQLYSSRIIALVFSVCDSVISHQNQREGGCAKATSALKLF